MDLLNAVAAWRMAESQASEKEIAPPLDALEKALGALMVQLSPVTVPSLRDTQWAGAGAPGLGFLGYI